MITIAYVDPGLGLLAWQALVAFFVGLLFYLRKSRTWITNAFRKLLRSGKPPETRAAFPPPPDVVAK